MRKNKKSLIGAIALAATMMTAVCFSACAPDNYSIDKLDGYVSEAAVSSNGGFVVEKGEYAYFINGQAHYTDDNTFGKVTKGALMRIKKSDLAAGNYATAKTVVPLLYAAQNYESGLYIYGDYVYFATPTTDKNKYGEVQNTVLDFKRAKLDGTDTMSGYYFRSEDNGAQYRFVEKGGVVYCMYVENGVLKSFNTATGEKKVLVEGAGTYYFDKSDAENGKVYYTMSVTDNVDSDEKKSRGYNQVYAVTPDAKATVSVSGGKASYTVSNAAGDNYRTYSYNKGWLEDNLDDFEADDYTTYPYVNLGELVLDGIGSEAVSCPVGPYNDEADVTSATKHTELKGHTYTIKSYQNGGLYFTRSKVLNAGAEGNLVYYLSDGEATAQSWNTVTEDFAGKADVVVDPTAAFDSDNKALYTYDEATGEHEYFYVDTAGKLCKESAKPDGVGGWDRTSPVTMVGSATGATLLFVDGEYLYYYGSGSSNLSRINYTGEENWQYQYAQAGEEYAPSTMTQMEFNTAWYKPEFVGDTLLYSDARQVGGTSYNYICAVDMAGSNATGGMTAAELNDKIEKYEEVKKYIDETVANNFDSQTKEVMSYIFRADTMAAFLDVEDLYSEVQATEVKAFAGHAKSTNTSKNDYSTMFKDGEEYYDRESYYVAQVGATSSADTEKIAEGLASSLLKRTADAEEDEDFPVWAIVLISVGGALVVATAVTVPLVIYKKKKAKAKADREATAVRKRKKIDTTDDKTIDVYADEREEAAEEVEEVKAEEEAMEEAQPSDEAEAAVEAPVEEQSEVQE